MDSLTTALLVCILAAVIINSVLQQRRHRELQNIEPEVTEEPDYIERFKELAPGALFEVLKMNKSEVEGVVLKDLPLAEIKKQNDDIIARFDELDELTEQFKKDNESTRATTKGLSMALSVGIGERGNWGESSFESILNMSGLVDGVTYHPELVLTKSSKPKSRPDFTVMLADGSAIAIDSKALLGPLVSLYDQAMATPSEKDRNAAFSFDICFFYSAS